MLGINAMWRLLFLQTCCALNWWSMLRMLKESRTEETIAPRTLLFSRDNQHISDLLMTDIIPVTLTTCFSTELLSGKRSPYETVLAYDYNNLWGGNTNKPQKGKKTVIRTNEITGTPTIKTSISSGTLKARL